MNAERRYFDAGDNPPPSTPSPAASAMPDSGGGNPPPDSGEWAVSFTLRSGEQVQGTFRIVDHTHWVAVPERPVSGSDVASLTTCKPPSVEVTYEFTDTPT